MCYFKDIYNTENNTDVQSCLKTFQYHKCNTCCLKQRTKVGKSEEKKYYERRICKSGAVVELTSGKRDTPGFQLKNKPEIVNDLRGFKRLDMPRNNKWVIQTSLFLAQGW